MKTKTGDEYRAAREESFDRCDTDGFLSQWANGISANVADLQGDIDAHDGRAIFNGLYAGDVRVAAREVEGRFGLSWLLRDDEARKYGRKFVPCGRRSRIQKELGLAERRELAPAHATIKGRGKGLSGSAWAAQERTGDAWGLDAALATDEDCKDFGELTDAQLNGGK